MRARAPGKLVISGAYAVLRGAPALVTAVDRYVVADDSKTADFKTPEVAQALLLLGSSRPHPAFDAGALREHGRKLGLGSSAAICAASVALLAQTKDAPLPAGRLAEQIYDTVLLAHRQAQGGGSGVDVAAACFGGTLGARVTQDGEKNLELNPVHLPEGVLVETWASPKAAVTSEFVKRVFALENSDPVQFAELLGQQVSASEQALKATVENQASDLIRALKAQFVALSALGAASGVPIVLPEIAELTKHLGSGECLLPSGAGGGDITLFVSQKPSSGELRERAETLGLRMVPLQLGAQGVHFLDN